MRTAALLVALMFTSPAWSQADKPAAKPVAAKPAADKPVADKGAPEKPMRKASSKRQEDARHCLEQSSNTAIIKCAEAYL
jgi:hypothetical protein